MAVIRRVFVQVWTEIDPTLNVRIDRGSGEPQAEDGDLLRRISPPGRTGVTAALALGPAEVTAFSVGPGHVDALRHALAAGAADAVELTSSAEQEPPSVLALAEWLGSHTPDVVIAGPVAGLLAGRLGWAHLAGLDELELGDTGLRAVRHLGRGEREVVTARLPAVIRLHTEAPHPPYVSRARIRAVPPDAVRREQLPAGVGPAAVKVGPLQPVRARTRLGQQPQPSGGRGLDRLAALLSGPTRQDSRARPSAPAAASPEEMAEEFVRYLIHHGLLRDDE